MDPAVRDIEFLARSEHRIGAFEALTDGRRDRRDLRAATGASSPTIGRIVGDFEDRRWIVRDGSSYELTPLGEFVADRFLELREGMRTGRTLRDVWRWLPREMDGFSVECFADAVVSYPGPGYPYQPVERVTRLLESTESIRGLGTTVYKSGNLETFCRRVLEGMDAEYVYSPSVLRAVIAWNPELTARVLERENCTILIDDDLPDDDRCGLNIMDDRIGICGHDPETAQLEAVIDTRSLDVREWAMAVYEECRREARPFEVVDFLDADRDRRGEALHVEPQ